MRDYVAPVIAGERVELAMVPVAQVRGVAPKKAPTETHPSAADSSGLQSRAGSRAKWGLTGSLDVVDYNPPLVSVEGDAPEG